MNISISPVLVNIARLGDLNSLKHFIKPDKQEVLFYLCEILVIHGHVDCFKYVYDILTNEHRLKELKIYITDYAAVSGNINFLEYVQNKLLLKFNATTASRTAFHINCECLQYLHKQQCPIDERVAVYSMYANNTRCLEYIIKNNLPWSTVAYDFAFSENNIDCIKLAHKNNMPYNEQALALLVEYVIINDECRKYFTKNMIEKKQT